MKHALTVNILYFQQWFFRTYTCFLRELVIQRTAYHSLNQAVIVPIRHVLGINVFSVTDNGNPVTELEQLFQLMGYEDDSDTLRP